MSWTPKVQFENLESARQPTDHEIESKLAQGRVSNTALSMYQAARRPGFGTATPYARHKFARRLHTGHPRHAVEISDPSLDRSDETSIAINPKNPRNIVAGAASFDGSQFINTAYVSKDGGNTWKTVTALTNTSEGAGNTSQGLRSELPESAQRGRHFPGAAARGGHIQGGDDGRAPRAPCFGLVVGEHPHVALGSAQRVGQHATGW